MDGKDATKSPMAKPVVPQRSIANSLKSIMQSRHPNTRRNIKRRPPGPIIYDMIVVKDYDQMESLRQVLELPARVYGPPPVDVKIEDLEKLSAGPEPLVNTPVAEPAREASRKRKCDDEEEPTPTSSEEGEERAVKKRRISIEIEDIINVDMPKSPRTSYQKSHPFEKENIPPKPLASAEKIPEILWRNDREIYSWPAFMKRVDTHFELSTLLVDTRT